MEGVFFNRDIHIRVTPEEQEKIRENAEVSGLSMSEYIRRRECFQSYAVREDY